MYSFLGSHEKEAQKVYEVAMNEVAFMDDVIGDHVLKLLDWFQNSV